MRHHGVGGLWLWRRDGGGGCASFSHLRSLGPVSRPVRCFVRTTDRPSTRLYPSHWLLSLWVWVRPVAILEPLILGLARAERREAKGWTFHPQQHTTATPRLRNLSGQTRARLLSRSLYLSLRPTHSLVCRLQPQQFSLVCDNYFVKHEARRIRLSFCPRWSH